MGIELGWKGAWPYSCGWDGSGCASAGQNTRRGVSPSFSAIESTQSKED
jgi:hypothetical protein